MKTKIAIFNQPFVLSILVGGMLLCNGCNKNTGEPMDLDVTLAGIYNTVNKWSATNGTTDAIFVTNDQYDNSISLDPAYQLVWDGNAFSASYTDEYLTPAGYRIVTVVDISGELSSNYKTLITFSGTHTQTHFDLSVGGGSDEFEYRLNLHDVPLEVGSTDLVAFIQGNVQKYVTSAYWRHTTINASTNVTSETGDLDFSDSNTELNVTFRKVY
jgi:hypothetical protein